MNPYFAAINYPQPKDSAMIMVLPDFQVARSTPNFLTGMTMVEYGITPRWTAGFMVEGQKLNGLPTTYGGLRVNTYVHAFPHEHLLNFTLYGEYENLNGAALYKMEVSGFGGEDLSGLLAVARHIPAHTFEQRAIMYHDWGQLNVTFNFVSETNLESSENDFGYVWGVFKQPALMGMTMGGSSAGMQGEEGFGSSSRFSSRRLGFGVEMMGALGNTEQFGFDWPRQQQYAGPVFSYALSKRWSVHAEPTFGLSGVSDPFVLRMGVGYSIDNLTHRLARVF